MSVCVSSCWAPSLGGQKGGGWFAGRAGGVGGARRRRWVRPPRTHSALPCPKMKPLQREADLPSARTSNPLTSSTPPPQKKPPTIPSPPPSSLPPPLPPLHSLQEACQPFHLHFHLTLRRVQAPAVQTHAALFKETQKVY